MLDHKAHVISPVNNPSGPDASQSAVPSPRPSRRRCRLAALRRHLSTAADILAPPPRPAGPRPAGHPGHGGARAAAVRIRSGQGPISRLAPDDPREPPAVLLAPAPVPGPPGRH